MNHKSPAPSVKPGDMPGQINRIYDKLVYWLYERQDAPRALRFAKQMEPLLSTSEIGAIFAEECWSLVYEAKGDLGSAIRHRKKEIRLIRRLHRISKNTDGEDFVFRQYDYFDLRDRLVLLAMLNHDSGELDKAITTLQNARKLCNKLGIEFDEADLLVEYQEEKKLNPLVRG